MILKKHTHTHTHTTGGYEGRADMVLSSLGLEECAGQAIGGANIERQISGGQRRRVSIGVELCMEPALLLLDEPTSGLDSGAAMLIFSLVRDLASAGCAVVTTLHQPNDAMFLRFDQLVLLVGGETVFVGAAKRAERYFAQRGHGERAPGVPVADYLLETASEPSCYDKGRASEDGEGDLGGTFERGTFERSDSSTGADECLDIVSAGGDIIPLATLLEIGDERALPWLAQTALLLRRSYLAHRLELTDPLFLLNIGMNTAFCENTIPSLSLSLSRVVWKSSTLLSLSLSLASCRFSITLWTSIGAALWWGRASERPRTQSSVEDTMGLLFFQCVYWGFQLMRGTRRFCVVCVLCVCENAPFGVRA